MAREQMAPARAAGSAATPLTKPKGLDHVNLHVRNADVSLRFYTEVLGLTIDHVDRDEEGRAGFVVLDAGPHKIFLMHRPEYVPPESTRARGLNHICIEVEPAEPTALREAFRARGVHLRSDLVWRGTVPRRTCSIYIEDPDGHGIEVKQALSPDQAAAWGGGRDTP